MRVALIPLRTLPGDPWANRREVEARLSHIAPRQPDLVCLPESALTGYLYRQQDLERFAEPVPGDSAAWFSQLAKAFSLYLCTGLLERTPLGYYSSALLFDRQGRLLLHYRKMEEKPPFLRGDAFLSADTPFGRFGVLLCGDVFSEQVRQKARGSADWLLVPMARSFDNRSPDAERWEREERQAYLDAVRETGITAFLVNALEVREHEPAFGGALIVNANGYLLAESPHGTDDILFWDSDHATVSLL